MNSNFLNILRNQSATYTPLWLMRQAGRYLPEYRQTRAKAGSFLSLCKNPDLATEVTLQPIRRFNLDASIMFSDILVVPEAMGLNLHFTEGEGPKFDNPINNQADILNLKTIYPAHDLGYVMQTIKNLKQELPKNIPLIGFSGSPWTLACYMLEGGASKNYEKIKALLYQSPDTLHLLLNKIAIAVADYLIEQIKSGVDCIMLFDSWGGVLSEAAFKEFSLKYLDIVIKQIRSLGFSDIPIISFTKGGGNWIEFIDQIGCNAIGVDWTINLAKARKSTQKILQGNLDPVLLSVADSETIIKETKKILDSYYLANNNSYDRLIFNLGHGILPSAKPDNVATLIDTVHSYTQR
ncbi:uroporphyrinogen decarboxylase [Aquella oligotrophica]|uniref:Uroporphyrinogen decarboxylase n=1 Tax=Aquella oligotrophica TaxID=2067065 RepID=A0A2I7N372_9NEIS|nr:uroporphyrinogen decarboxylase [Aquella oligotrophica]AUR50906.1 uroporphyrinogen decarboxylase [Aquella oligotrophica]